MTNKEIFDQLLKDCKEHYTDTEHLIFFNWLEQERSFQIMMAFVTHLCYRNPSILSEINIQCLKMVMKDLERDK